MDLDYRAATKSLARVIEEGFKTEPYYDRYHGVFRTHYDWHSSALGHWALLAAGNFLHDDAITSKVLRRLTPEALESERLFLAENPLYECPYGRAWLALLLTELKRHCDYPQIVELQNQTMDVLFSWLEATPFPDGTGGAARGAYQSWIFTYFLLHKCDLAAPFATRLQSLRPKYVTAGTIRDESGGNAFLSASSIAAILDGVVRDKVPHRERLQKIGPVTIANCHSLGIILSEYWPHAALGRSHPREKAFFESFASDFLAEPRFWRTDYFTVSHWVPQYIWFGFWLLMNNSK